MVKSFSTISALALAALAQANYMAVEKPAEYAPPAEEYVSVIPTTSCTTDSTDYPVPTGYEHAPEPYVTPVEYPVPTASVYEPEHPVDTGYPVTPEVHEPEYPVEEPTPYQTYTSVYTSCEVIPTVYTSDGVPCTTDYTSTHELTTTVCESTPVETPCPTTITKTYETTYSSCVTYPTTCSTDGTTYTTSSTDYATSTICTTEVYSPVATPIYTHPGDTNVYKPVDTPDTTHPVTDVYNKPVTDVYNKPVTDVYNKPVTDAYNTPVTEVHPVPTGTGYPVPVPSHPTNTTSYTPGYPQYTGAASFNAPNVAAFAVVVGGIVAALF